MANTAPISNVIDRSPAAGIAGEVYSHTQATKDSVRLDQVTATPSKYGVALVAVAGKFRQFAAGNDGSDVKGALIRTEPAITELDGSPKKDAIHGRIARGPFFAPCTIGTPVREGQVYIRTVEDGDKLVGDYEATEAAGENVAVPTWVWHLDGKDANDIAVIRIGN